MVRIEATADDSLAAIRARSKFGIAIAAMIRMMATTISNSISEKPFCFRISLSPPWFLPRRSRNLAIRAVRMLLSSLHLEFQEDSNVQNQEIWANSLRFNRKRTVSAEWRPATGERPAAGCRFLSISDAWLGQGRTWNSCGLTGLRRKAHGPRALKEKGTWRKEAGKRNLDKMKTKIKRAANFRSPLPLVLSPSTRRIQP